MKSRQYIGHGGFALIEAMVAALIMAFGMLAIIGMQLSLSKGADAAKARTEATRLAQERMEQLRSYAYIDPPTAGAAWADEPSWSNFPVVDPANPETVTTNNTYTITWSTGNGGMTTDVMRTARVTVAWTDRAGRAQNVTLSSVISKTDPVDSGFLGFPLPQNTNLKRPKNRNIDIPIPAIDLGEGKSGYQISDNIAVIFSNDSGMVIQICQSDAGITLNADYDTSSPDCVTSSALLVAGYISRDNSNTAWPTGINYSGITSSDNENIVCRFSVALNQTTNTALSNFMFYLCIIPVSDATVPPSTWGGKLLLGGLLPGDTGNRFVCRYQYTDTHLDNNARNIQPYNNVERSIDGQNYLVMTGSSSATCPAGDGVVLPVMHQNCRSNNADDSASKRASACPAPSANNFS